MSSILVAQAKRKSSRDRNKRLLGRIESALSYRGLRLDNRKLKTVRSVVDQFWARGRTAISLELCRILRFKQENGWPKERAMRDILRRLEAAGYIQLPPSLVVRSYTTKPRQPNQISDIDKSPIDIASWSDLKIVRVTRGAESRLWDSLVSEYHYLGRKPIVGRNLKQLVLLKDRPVSCLAWSDPCLKLGPRDEFLRNNLGAAQASVTYGVNNTRFLILPWVNVRNLASKLLALAKQHATKHWLSYYNVELRWAETFVDPTRFRGTCYRAANWRHVGMTAGTSRSGFSARRAQHGISKDILIYLF
jgi:hypothetical protein